MKPRDAQSRDEKDEAVPKCDRRAKYGEMTFGQLKEMRSLLDQSLNRVDDCLRMEKHFNQRSFQMQYRTASDRARKELHRFLQGLEAAMEMVARRTFRAEAGPIKRAYRRVTSRPSNRRALVWSAALGLLVAGSAGFYQLGSAVESSRNQRNNPVSHLPPHLANTFASAFERNLAKQRAAGTHFRAIVSDRGSPEGQGRSGL